MDGSASSAYRSASQSRGDKKRSSPPPLRSRPISPSPPPPIINGNGNSSTASASSSAYTSRTSATPRLGNHTPLSNGIGTAAASVNPYTPSSALTYGSGHVEEPAVMDLTDSGTPPPMGMGEYAYSTTLRRQPSIEHGFPNFSPPYGHGHGYGNGARRASSPHHSSPFRKRTASNPYANGIPSGSGRYDRVEEEAEEGPLSRMWGMGRRLFGKRDYEELREEEEGLQREKERRQAETPSSIYAHKTIDVRWCHRHFRLNGALK